MNKPGRVENEAEEGDHRTVMAENPLLGGRCHRYQG